MNNPLSQRPEPHLTELFLTKEDIAILTGRKMKRLQIEQLRKMGVPFFVNALNAPVVARSSIEGRPPTVGTPKPKWKPRVLERE
jgi:hypothetical protein